MKLRKLLAGVSCGVMLFGHTINGAYAEDQVRSYFLNDVPRMKAECRNAGGTWQGSYCSYPKSGGSSESSGGGSFLGALALAVIGGLIYCGADEDNCKSSSSGN